MQETDEETYERRDEETERRTNERTIRALRRRRRRRRLTRLGRVLVIRFKPLERSVGRSVDRVVCLDFTYT